MDVAPGERVAITLTVNGVEHDVEVEARRLLSDTLRHDLGLTGTHVGCEHGVCGCCTVLLDDQPVRSCLPLQQAFKEHHGLQCGFCTPGFLMLASTFYERAGEMSDDEIREALGGQLCRCTGYVGIVRAVRAAGESA